MINFDLPKDVSNNLGHGIDSIIKHNQFLVEQTKKLRLVEFSLNISMKTIFINTENSKMDDPNKIVRLLQRLNKVQIKMLLFKHIVYLLQGGKFKMTWQRQ